MSKISTKLLVQPTLLALAVAACTSSFAQESTQTLSEVVVSASGFEQELKQAPASISVVTREELERKSVRDLAEALHGVEGIDIRGGQGKTGGYNISMRGMPSGYTLLLVDGRRINPAGEITPNGFGDAYNAMIPPMSAIERIEVVRGPMSTLYGSDAMGGVINIITRKVAKEWAGAVTVEGSLPQTQGEGATQKTNFYLNGPIAQDKLGIAIRGGVLNRDGYDGRITGAPSNGGHSPAKADTHNLGAKLTFTPTQGQQFWLDAEVQRATYDNSTSQLGNLDGVMSTGGSPSVGPHGYGPELRFNREILSLGYEGRTQLGLLNTSLSHRTTETLGRTIPKDAAAATPSLAGTARLLESTSTVADAKLVTAIGEQHLITSGLQIAKEDARDGLSIITGVNKFSQTTWAVFAEDEWRFHPSFALTTGLRYDHHDKFGGHFSPRSYLVWDASDNWTFKGGVSKGFKAPRMNQLVSGTSGYSGQGSVQALGNPNLTPETSTSTELAAMFDSQKGWTSSVTLFHNKLKDKIQSYNCTGTNTPYPGCTPPAGTSATTTYLLNAPSAKTYGAEFSNKWQLQHGVDLKLSYTWTKTQLITDGEKTTLDDVAKHLLLANATWKINQQWSTWLQAEYRAKAPRHSASNATVRAAEKAAMGDYYKAYSLVHIGVNYAYSPKVSFGLNINNLFDRNFRAKTGTYNNYFGGSGGGAKGTAQDGRTLWLRSTVQF